MKDTPTLPAAFQAALDDPEFRPALERLHRQFRVVVCDFVRRYRIHQRHRDFPAPGCVPRPVLVLADVAAPRLPGFGGDSASPLGISAILVHLLGQYIAAGGCDVVSQESAPDLVETALSAVSEIS